MTDFLEVVVNNKDYLSCDDLGDAVRSLSLFYGVDKDVVMDFYENNWPDFLPEDVSFCEFENPRLTWIFSCLLGVPRFVSPKLEVAFYHRTRFDGKPEWFEDGLLTAQDGVRQFFEKIRYLAGKCYWFDSCLTASVSNVKNRNEYEKTTGPHAFDIFFDAAYGQGNNYDVPEFCLRGLGLRLVSNEFKSFRLFCEENLKRVIVKFVAQPSCIDSYVRNLWFFLYKQKFMKDHSDPLSFNFHGGGKVVARNQIVELITSFDRSTLGT